MYVSDYSLYGTAWLGTFWDSPKDEPRDHGIKRPRMYMLQGATFFNRVHNTAVTAAAFD